MLEGLRRIKEAIKSLFMKNNKSAQEISPIQTFMHEHNDNPERAQKLVRIYRIHQENNNKLKEMNERIGKTIKKIEDVKKRMINARVNESELKKQAMKKDPIEFLKNKKLPNLPIREFAEFEDLHEFIKFNRMGSISEEEIKKCDWQDIFKKLCE